MTTFPTASGCGCQVCRPDHRLHGRRTPHADVYRKVLEAVEKKGWLVTGVGGEDGHLPFAYTVGLLHRGLPFELAIVGLHVDTMTNILNHTAGRAISGEIALTPGEERDDVVPGYPVRLMPTTPDRHELNLAAWFARQRTVPAVQIVWPDKESRFPGEDGCRLDVVRYCLR